MILLEAPLMILEADPLLVQPWMTISLPNTWTDTAERL